MTLQAAELAALQVPERVREETGRHEIMMDTVRSLGYEPELTVVDYNWENLLEPDEALQRFFNGRTMELEDTPDNRMRIRQALEQMTGEDGLIPEKVFTHVAWIWWKVS